jgi:predicted RNA binding protein YcfA (HicA-like mRNA interferase family)
MPKIPAANYRQVSKIARQLGFYCARKAKGSHEIWRRDRDGRQTTIPNHGNKPFKRKTFSSILKDFDISIDDFMKLK